MTVDLVHQVKSCTLCDDLPLGPKPIFQFGPKARILIAGQAPGAVTHHKGRPFDDASGIRLRQWLGVDERAFYDPAQFAIIPMGFCYPGKGASGDLPPRPICARTWHHQLLKELKSVELVVIIGKYALQWYLGITKSQTITNVIKEWHENNRYDDKISVKVDNGIKKAVTYIPLPHPSPRNNRWLKQNPWFENETIPKLQNKVEKLLRK